MWLLLLACVPRDTAPRVKVVSPEAGPVAGVLALEAEVKDDYGVTSVAWKFEGDTVLEGKTGEWDTAGIDTTGQLVVVATDSIGQVTRKPINLVLDNTDPVAEITAPGYGDRVHGVVDVTWTASDANGLVSEVLLVNGNEVSPPVDTENYDSGSLELTLIATDPAGNTGGETVVVQLDRPPEVDILLADGALLTEEATVLVKATDDGTLSSVKFFLDGLRKETDYSSPYRWDWDTCREDEGEYELRADAADNGGNLTQDSITVEVHRDMQVELSMDSVLPQSGDATLTAWVAGEDGTAPTLTVGGDEIGTLVASEGELADCPSSCTDTCTFYEGSFPVEGLAAGTYTVRVKAGAGSDSVSAVLPADADGDGYGDEVDGGLDCDDSDGDVNPDATEVCGDGVDNDCDDTANLCGWGTDQTTANADMRLFAGEYWELGGNVVSGGDTDGDGVNEVLVKGSSTVYLVEGPVTAGDIENQVRQVNGYAYFGYAMATVGDLDGDGTDELAVTNRAYDTVFLFHGPVTTGLHLDMVDIELTDHTDEEIGYGVGGMEMNGDGEPDVYVVTAGVRGHTYIFEGPVTSDRDVSEALHLYGADNYSTAREVTTGDLNGDGLDDVVIGAPNVEEVAIFFGPVTSDARHENGDVVLQDSANSYFGADVSIGDADGDGQADLAIGSPDANSNLGEVLLFSGPIGTGTAHGDEVASLDGRAAGDELGWEVTFVGDGDGDGTDELGLGVIRDSTVANQGGAVHVLYGPLSGNPDVDRDGTIQGTHEGGWLGYSLAGGSYEGQPVLVIGEPHADSPNYLGGAAYLYFDEGL